MRKSLTTLSVIVVILMLGASAAFAVPWTSGYRYCSIGQTPYVTSVANGTVTHLAPGDSTFHEYYNPSNTRRTTYSPVSGGGLWYVSATGGLWTFLVGAGCADWN